MTAVARAARFAQNRYANPSYVQTFHVVMDVESLAADTRYVLVDLSDTAGFPHDSTNYIIVRRIMFSVEQQTSGIYDVSFGVVKEVDATDGSVAWFKKINFEAGTQQDFDLSYPNGLSLELVSTAPSKWLTNYNEDDNVGWQTDVNLTSPLDATTPPGAGDLVMLVDEISGTGTLDFNVVVEYDVV